MPRPPRRSFLLASVLGLLAVTIAAAGLSSPAAASGLSSGTKHLQATSSAGVAVHRTTAGTSAARDRLRSYWTGSRMRAAVPFQRLLDRTRLRRSGREVARGTPTQVPPTVAGVLDAVPLALPELGAAWTGGGAVTKTAGRVFFTFQGSPASCSGDAVTSANKSVVLTAGHCVKYQGSWHTNWVFVPGYHDGARPHGTWPATTTLTTPQWQASEDLDYDVGAAVVASVGGRRLTDVVGGQGVAFNQTRGQTMYSFGYPAETPYDGESLTYCSGPTIDDPLGSTDHGLACDMNGGSSGGPWFLSFDEATGAGVQNSVNSFGYVFLPAVMFGPYFGTQAQALYKTAAAR